MTDTEQQPDEEAGGEAMDPLQAALAKQIKVFSSLFSMMDSDNENESLTAFKRLKTCILRINELQEQITGTPGDLRFVTLLEKIENGGGADPEYVQQLEEQLQKFVEENEKLFLAQQEIAAERTRAEFLTQMKAVTHQGKKNDITTPTDKAYRDMKAMTERLEAVVKAMPEAYPGYYERMLDAALGKRFGGAQGPRPKIRQRAVGFILRRMQYPIDTDDAIRLQDLAVSQRSALKQSTKIQEKLDKTTDVIGALTETLRVALLEGGEIPELNEAVKLLTQANKQIEAMTKKVETLQTEVATTKAEAEMQIAEFAAANKKLERMTGRLDTRIRQLVNHIIDGRMPVTQHPIMDAFLGAAKKTEALPPMYVDEDILEVEKANDKKAKGLASKFAKQAIDWTDPEHLLRRIRVFESGGAMRYRAGKAFKRVTLNELLKEMAALHAVSLALREGKTDLAAEGDKILDSHILMPREEHTAFAEAQKEMNDRNNMLEGQVASLNAENSDLDYSLSRERTRAAALSTENQMQKQEIRHLQSKLHNNFWRAVALIGFAFMGGTMIDNVLEDRRPPVAGYNPSNVPWDKPWYK